MAEVNGTNGDGGQFNLVSLAQLRLALRKTQREVGDAIGVSQSRVARIERAGPSRLTLCTVEAYVAALGGQLVLVAEINGRRVLIR